MSPKDSVFGLSATAAAQSEHFRFDCQGHNTSQCIDRTKDVSTAVPQAIAPPESQTAPERNATLASLVIVSSQQVPQTSPSSTACVELDLDCLRSTYPQQHCASADDDDTAELFNQRCDALCPAFLRPLGKSTTERSGRGLLPGRGPFSTRIPKV